MTTTEPTTLPELASGMARVLNHVELVRAPGERALAHELFELLGFGVRDSGGPFLTARIRPEAADLANSCLYASEVTPEQWSLEQALRDSLADGTLRDAGARYVDRLRAEPQRSCHFGIRYPTLDDLDATVVQAFVHTDVVASGLLTFGQHIELQWQVR